MALGGGIIQPSNISGRFGGGGGGGGGGAGMDPGFCEEGLMGTVVCSLPHSYENVQNTFL